MFDGYVWVGLPVLVFFARVVDVSLGTLRIIFTARGLKHIAPLLGFVEVFIWISAVAQITKGAHNFMAYLGYAAGFAAGTYLGMYIENRLAVGMVVVRAILPVREVDVTLALRARGYGFTLVEAHGSQGAVHLIYVVVSRKRLAEALELIQSAYPNAFYTVEELRAVAHGVFPFTQQDEPFIKKTK